MEIELTDIGVTALGVYVPRLRLDRKIIAEAHHWAIPGLASEAKGEKAICDFDEDALTMAVEAVRGLGWTEQRGLFDRLVLASTSLPFAEPSNSAMMAAALGLPDTLGVTDATGSIRAGTSALLDALKRQGAASLVVASDDRKTRPASVQEMRYGAAAVAIGVGAQDVLARFLGGTSVTKPIVDRFRMAGHDFDYLWEERWVRDEGYVKIVAQTIIDLVGERGIDLSRVRYLLTASNASVTKLLAKAIGVDDVKLVEAAQRACGHAGAAAPFLELSLALETASPGDIILMANLGYGCDVLALEVTDAIGAYQKARPASAALARRRAEPNYLKYLAFSGALDLDWGMRAEFDPRTSLTQAYRVSEQLTAFVAGQCPDCGTVQFPVLAACVSCASTAATIPHPLAEEPARMATFTADWLSYTISPPIHLGLVQFDSGARVFMAVADMAPTDTLAVGAPVRMVFRRKDHDTLRGYVRYFWKAAPHPDVTGSS